MKQCRHKSAKPVGEAEGGVLLSWCPKCGALGELVCAGGTRWAWTRPRDWIRAVTENER
jgi:hypothetical protein